MKIFVTATEKSLDANVNQMFGRCPFFALVDTEDMSADFLENPAVSASGGAGIKTAQAVLDSGATAVISGNIGPKAFSTLSAGKVKVFAVPAWTIREAVEKLKNNELKETITATGRSHMGSK